MPHTRRLSHEWRVLLLSLLAGVPGGLAALILVWTGEFSLKAQITVTVAVVIFWLWFAFAVRESVVFPLQTISNLLAALREGDYSIRGRGATPDDALGEVLVEVNALGDALREQRLVSVEAVALLRSVMAEIDVAVLAFDPHGAVRVANRAAERLLGENTERLLGRTAAELGLDQCLEGDPERILEPGLAGHPGRWSLRRRVFREEGVPHQLVVLSDVSRELREEERTAWQRLVRVMGHEINNSLAPIQSIAGSLEKLLDRDPAPADWKEDMASGLHVIASRSAALGRFTSGYSALARLPRPNLRPVPVAAWVQRVTRLETRVPLLVVPGPEATIQADSDQLDQLLLNLLRNAAEAAIETSGGVAVTWTAGDKTLELSVTDDGPGLADTANLFVPFFTTKPSGSGIGLPLSRQIAEAHGGTLTLVNRSGARGCVAILKLPC